MLAGTGSDVEASVQVSGGAVFVKFSISVLSLSGSS